MAEKAVAAYGLIGSDDMEQLVMEGRVDPFVGRSRFESVADRGYRHGYAIAGSGAGAGIAVVHEIVQEDSDFLRRREIKEFPVETERILETTGNVRHDVGLELAEINQAQVLGFELVELTKGSWGSGG